MLRPVIHFVFALAALPALAVEPVALVTELSGSGSVEVLQDLVPGARLTLASGARAVVVHTGSGVVYELSGPGRFQVRAKDVAATDSTARINRRDLPAEIRAYRLNPAVAAQASIVLRSGGEFRLDGPDGGVLSEDELRYAVSGPLKEMRLDVLDEPGANLLRIDRADGTVELKGRHAWKAGERYRVEASGLDARGRTVTLKSSFRLIPDETGARLRSQQPAASSATTDWIVYALALESVGANASARAVWRGLNPGR